MRLAAIILALLLCFQGQAATILFDISDFTSTPSAFKTLRMAPTTTPSVSGTNIIVSDSRMQTTTTYGRLYFSNVVAATYQCTFTGPNVTTTFQITVTNYSGIINAKDIITVSTNSVAGLNAYSMASSDVRYLHAVYTNGVAVATNPILNVVLGTNMAIRATNDTTNGRTDLYISSNVGAGSGEANTSSNTGDGVGIANAKSSVDLPFKSFKSANDLGAWTTNETNITLTLDTTPQLKSARLEASGAATTVLTNRGVSGTLSVRLGDDSDYGFVHANLLGALNATVAAAVLQAGGDQGLSLSVGAGMGWSAGDSVASKDTWLARQSAGAVVLSATTTNAVPTGTLSASNSFWAGKITNDTLTASRPVLSGASKELTSGQIDLASASHVTGTLPTANIADNAVTGAKIAMGSDAAGDILYYNGTDYVRLPKGTAGQVLEMNAGATAPEWDTDDSGDAGSQTPIAQDVNWALFKATNVGRLTMVGAITATPTNLVGDVPDFLMLGHSVATFTPTNTAMVNLPTPTGADWVWPPKLISIVSTGAHVVTFSNAVQVNTLVLRAGDTNWFEVWYDGITNRVLSLQELTTGSGATVLSNAPTILNATLTTPTIGSFANATHNHQDAAGGGALAGEAITSGTVADARIASTISRDTEWDTESEVQTAWGGVNIILATEIDTVAEIEAIAASVNILLETEIDASSELRALMDDESGTGALLFAGGNIEAGTATTPSTGDNDTSVATTAFVSSTLVSSNYQTRAVYREIWIPAGAMTPAGVNGPSTNQYAGADRWVDVFAFDDTTAETNYFTISMPDAWDRGTIKARYHWTASSGTAAQGVTWGIAGAAISDDDVMTTAFGTRFTVTDAYIASGDMHVSAASSAITVGGSPALNDMLLFEVVRVQDVGDTKTGDANLIGVKIQYRESTGDVASW